MGEIADRFGDAAPPTRRRFAAWLAGLDDADREVVLGWLHDPDVPHVWISRTLAEVGVQFEPHQIAFWRAKQRRRGGTDG